MSQSGSAKLKSRQTIGLRRCAGYAKWDFRGAAPIVLAGPSRLHGRLHYAIGATGTEADGANSVSEWSEFVGWATLLEGIAVRRTFRKGTVLATAAPDPFSAVQL
jgi:hypothetical protein